MKNLLILTLFVVLFNPYIQGQIINVENYRIVMDSTGWAGSANVSFAASKFTKSYSALSTGAHIQYRNPKDLVLIVLDYDLVSAGGEKFNNRAYGHFRYNRKFSSLFRYELFNQVQFNSVTKIDLRWLIGTGVRLKLSQVEKFKTYFGLTYMFEYEELSDPEIFHRDHRMSSYITFTIKSNFGMVLTNTSYFQPLFNNFSDYRFSDDVNLSFKITKNLMFTTRFHLLYDSEPPLEVPNLNYQIRNGLLYRF